MFIDHSSNNCKLNYHDNSNNLAVKLAIAHRSIQFCRSKNGEKI